jgi:hypothetical protein
MSTLPVEALASYNLRYSIDSKSLQSGDGFIEISERVGGPSTVIQPDVPLGDHRMFVEQLVNHFFAIHSPLFPVLSRADFIASSPFDPLLLYVICGTSSISLRMPSGVMRMFRAHISNLFRRDDFGETSNLQTVQALLLYVWTLELEPRLSSSKAWNTLGPVGRPFFGCSANGTYSFLFALKAIRMHRILASIASTAARKNARLDMRRGTIPG